MSFIFPEMHLTFSTKTEEIGGTTTGIIQLTIVISQDHPMTPDRLSVRETKIYFVDSLILNFRKYEAIAFGRTSSC